MAITIRKMRQPVADAFRKTSFTFYRVKNNGVFVQDYKTKFEAIKRANILRFGK